jgi:CRP/FNR family cyclic AMP-dependent transcriptional regulator
MVSPELLRRYPYFGGLNVEQISVFAKTANEKEVEKDYFFFKEDDLLDSFYLLIEGEVGIVTEIPRKSLFVQSSTIVPGEVFGWSGLVPPHKATASAKALTTCKIVEFDAPAIRQKFQEDCGLGFLMMQRTAAIISERLKDLRIESLASRVD